MPATFSRRDALLVGGAAIGTSLGAGSNLLAAEPNAKPIVETSPRPARFRHCLNTSTIRGQKLPLVDEIDIAAKAGYEAIEPWLREIDEYVKTGGSLSDLRKRLSDNGLAVPSAIGFAQWIVDDDATRTKGLEQAKRDMDTLAQIGGTGIAAPPAGATMQADLSLFKAAERFRALCGIGQEMNVTPMAEVWGFSKCLSRLGETAFVAIEAGHPRAAILPDVYHIYKGGSDFAGLRCLSGPAMRVFHVNDYPAEPPRGTIKDADRVYCGDGVAPLGEIFAWLRVVGFDGYLSLELFNPGYWQQDALTVAKTGLEKTKAALG